MVSPHQRSKACPKYQADGLHPAKARGGDCQLRRPARFKPYTVFHRQGKKELLSQGFAVAFTCLLLASNRQRGFPAMHHDW